jgi:hypothetical protein
MDTTIRMAKAHNIVLADCGFSRSFGSENLTAAEKQAFSFSVLVLKFMRARWFL